MPELYVGREAPELKRVEGRSVTVKRETTRPMLKLAGSDQNPLFGTIGASGGTSILGISVSLKARLLLHAYCRCASKIVLFPDDQSTILI